ncbi:unnamed protein product, partial [Vitis vinifera]
MALFPVYHYFGTCLFICGTSLTVAFTMDFFIWLFKEPDSCKLGECRIILCEAGATHRLQKLQLNFPSDDVAFALKDDKELPWLAKYL